MSVAKQGRDAKGTMTQRDENQPDLSPDMTQDGDRPAIDRTAPIGVFDSGVGGLTVARAIVDQLPHESMIYVGDTANGPYGPLRIAEVREHAEAIADDLVARGCKMIVIACNTASAAFLRDARERYPVPVVEVILPAVRRAVSATRNGKVGVIGTAATIRSRAYQDLFDAVPGVDVSATDCPRFVDFVERGITSGRQILGLAEETRRPTPRGPLGLLAAPFGLLRGAFGLPVHKPVGRQATSLYLASQMAPGRIIRLSNKRLSS